MAFLFPILWSCIPSYIYHFINTSGPANRLILFKKLGDIEQLLLCFLFGHVFALELTVDRTEMSRRGKTENQGNSGLAEVVTI